MKKAKPNDTNFSTQLGFWCGINFQSLVVYIYLPGTDTTLSLLNYHLNRIYGSFLDYGITYSDLSFTYSYGTLYSIKIFFSKFPALNILN